MKEEKYSKEEEKRSKEDNEAGIDKREKKKGSNTDTIRGNEAKEIQ